MNPKDEENLEAAIDEAFRRRGAVVPPHLRARLKAMLQATMGADEGVQDILRRLRDRVVESSGNVAADERINAPFAVALPTELGRRDGERRVEPGGLGAGENLSLDEVRDLGGIVVGWDRLLEESVIDLEISRRRIATGAGGSSSSNQ